MDLFTFSYVVLMAITSKQHTSAFFIFFVFKQYLRYLCELDWIHPEDNGRRFVMAYSLADGSIKIGEIPRRNSGIREGKFLQAMKLQTPESDPNFPTYYTPDRFYIGEYRTYKFYKDSGA